MDRFEKADSIRRRLQVSVTVAVASLFAIGALAVYLSVRAHAMGQFRGRLEHRLIEGIDETEMDVEAEVDAGFHDIALVAFEAGRGRGVNKTLAHFAIETHSHQEFF